MGNKYCVTLFESLILLERRWDRKRSKRCWSHIPSITIGNRQQKKTKKQTANFSILQSSKHTADLPFSNISSAGTPAGVSWFRSELQGLTTARCSWTWSAAGTSCGSGPGCTRCTRYTGGSMCCDYPPRSWPRGPSAPSLRLWGNKESRLSITSWLPEALHCGTESICGALAPLDVKFFCSQTSCWLWDWPLTWFL